MQSVLSVSTIFWDESVRQFGRPREAGKLHREHMHGVTYMYSLYRLKESV